MDIGLLYIHQKIWECLFYFRNRCNLSNFQKAKNAPCAKDLLKHPDNYEDRILKGSCESLLECHKRFTQFFYFRDEIALLTAPAVSY